MKEISRTEGLGSYLIGYEYPQKLAVSYFFLIRSTAVDKEMFTSYIAVLGTPIYTVSYIPVKIDSPSIIENIEGTECIDVEINKWVFVLITRFLAFFYNAILYLILLRVSKS